MNHPSSSGPTTLISAVWPPGSLAREVILILAGSLLIALSARVSFTIGPVPITGQTFGVLFVAGLLGRRAALSVLIYLAQGAMGLPVFAGGAAGAGQLLGPSGGYLLGFIPAAYVTGWLCESGWDRSFGRAILAMLVGNIIIYTFGILWLSNFVPWNRILAVGLVPFIPGDVLKIIAAAGLLPLGWKWISARP